ncbi:MAG: hypothetical protein ACFFE8_03540, partial [Candidatus Heimdallarchaeota archaeon]
LVYSQSFGGQTDSFLTIIRIAVVLVYPESLSPVSFLSALLFFFADSGVRNSPQNLNLGFT